MNKFLNKINDVLESLYSFKNEIDKRFNKIKKYLELLKFINNNYLIDFNYNYFDYYNKILIIY